MIDFLVLSPSVVNAIALITAICSSYLTILVGRVICFTFIYWSLYKLPKKENI